MPAIFRYFWFLAAGIMLINVLIWKRRLAPLADRGLVSKNEVAGFLRGATIWLVGGSLVAGFISLWAGWPFPLCAGILSFADVPSMLMSVLAIVSWAALLWWVWRGNGADFLARVLPELDRRPTRLFTPTPTSVRVGVTVLTIISAVASPIIWRQMPLDPAMGCPAPNAVRSPTR